MSDVYKRQLILLLLLFLLLFLLLVMVRDEFRIFELHLGRPPDEAHLLPEVFAV